MRNFKTLTAATLATLCLSGLASAEILKGEVYQVSGGDVYVKMADTTVARVPVETAHFYRSGVITPWANLSRGESVTVDYTPVYGFQRYYYSSSEVANPNPTYPVYLDLDVDTASVDEYIEYEGKLYHRIDR